MSQYVYYSLQFILVDIFYSRFLLFIGKDGFLAGYVYRPFWLGDYLG